MPPRRILVIEDDSAIRRGIVDALRFKGYDADRGGATARTGCGWPRGATATWSCSTWCCRGRAGWRSSRRRARRPADAAGHHPDGQGRGERPRAGAVRRRGRLRGEAVQREGVAGPRRGGAAAVAGAADRRGHGRRSPAALRTCSGARSASTTAARAELSEKEVELLRYLAQNAGRAISRDEILSRVWRIDPRGGETRTIDMHVARLREKLRDDPHQPRRDRHGPRQGLRASPGPRPAAQQGDGES